MVRWGTRLFGTRQSEIYEHKVVDLFDSLAHSPDMGRLVETAHGSVRTLTSGAHRIIYRVEDGRVVILRVLHHLQAWPDDL
jgi:plasmid stabilization system protein ParE